MSEKRVKFKVRFGAKPRSRRRCLDVARAKIDKLQECDAESKVTAASVATLSPTLTLSTDPNVGDVIVSYSHTVILFLICCILSLRILRSIHV